MSGFFDDIDKAWKGKRVDKKLGPVHEQIARENAMSEAVNQSEAVPETALN